MKYIAAATTLLGVIGMIASAYMAIWGDYRFWGQMELTSLLTFAVGGLLCWAHNDFEEWNKKR